MLFSRKEFIKITALAGASAILAACGVETESNEATKISEDKNSAKTGKPDIFKPKDSDNVVYISSDNKEYDELRNGFSKRINKFPAVIALCYNSTGVQEAVLFAKEQNLKIAIKSGGHCFEGFSSNDNGMVINVSKLKTFELSDDHILKIGPGFKLGEIYEKLLEQSRIIPAGSCAGVGISGLTLGGGYGLFSREFGLTCDNLLDLEIVTADGKIMSCQEDPDLFWALKGGGNGNFGVVTQLTFKTHESPKWLQSNRFKAHNLDVTRAETILKKWFEVTKSLPNDCFSAFVLNGKSLTILITNFKEAGESLNTVFSELTSVTDKATIGTHVGLASAIKVFQGQTNPIFFKNASVGIYNDFNDIASISSVVMEKVIHGRGLIYQINTLGGIISNSEFEKTSSFPYRSYPYLSELQCYWESESKSNDFIQKFQEVQSLFLNAGLTKQYVNYPAIENENFETAYYGNNLQKLKDVKSRYDPENLFCHAQSIVGNKPA